MALPHKREWRARTETARPKPVAIAHDATRSALRDDRVRDDASDIVGRIEHWGWRIAVAGAVAAAAAQMIDFGVYDLRIRLLDMSTHASLFGAVSVLALVSVGCLALLLAIATPTRSAATSVLPLLCAILLALRVLHPTHVVLLALPFAAATFIVLWWGTAERGSAARRMLRYGCATLVGSYAIHAFGTSIVSALGYGEFTWPYQIKLMIKHSGELGGWTVVATGLAMALAAAFRRPSDPEGSDRGPYVDVPTSRSRSST